MAQSMIYRNRTRRMCRYDCHVSLLLQLQYWRKALKVTLIQQLCEIASSSGCTHTYIHTQTYTHKHTDFYYTLWQTCIISHPSHPVQVVAPYYFDETYYYLLRFFFKSCDIAKHLAFKKEYIISNDQWDPDLLGVRDEMLRWYLLLHKSHKSMSEQSLCWPRFRGHSRPCRTGSLLHCSYFCVHNEAATFYEDAR